MIQNNNKYIEQDKPIFRKVPNLPVRKAAETLKIINQPSPQFIDIVTKKSPTIWVILNKQIFLPKNKQLLERLKELLADFSSSNSHQLSQEQRNINKSQQIPIFNSIAQARKFHQGVKKRLIVDQNIFQAVQILKDDQEIISFDIISPHNYQLARKAIQIAKVKQIHSNYDQVIKYIINTSQKLSTVLIRQNSLLNTLNGNSNISEIKETRRYDLLFPNFMKLSQHDKSSLRKYRINMYGLRSLSQDDKMSSRKMFGQYIRKLYRNDQKINYGIDNYLARQQSDQWILIQYTKDSFLYRSLNSTLRIAQKTEEFFTVGEPFNRVFKSIQKFYRSQQKNYFQEKQVDKLKVYRRARLTNQQADYLKTHIGSYIQVLGFMSTSKDKNIALGFDDKQGNDNGKVHIIQIILKQTKFVNQRFAELDYGFVDLHERNLTVHPQQQEVLINAMNIFKIMDYRKHQKYQYFVLQYGAIFDLMLKQQIDLTVQDKQAYTDYLALEELGLDITDMGAAFVKTHNWTKAHQYFTQKKSKAKSMQQQAQHTFNLAQAYHVGYKIDQALKQYQSCIQSLKKSQESMILDQSRKKDINISSFQVNQKIAQTNILCQNFEEAQSKIFQLDSQIDSQIFRSAKKFDSNLMLKKAKIKQDFAYSKKKQDLFEQQREALIELQKIYQQIQKNIEELQIDEQKSLLIKQTQLYEELAALEAKAELFESTKRVQTVKKKFMRKNSELTAYLHAASYESSVLQRRALQLQTQSYILTKKRNQQYESDQLNKYKKRYSQDNNKVKSIPSVFRRELSLTMGKISKEAGSFNQQNVKTFSLMSSLVQQQIIPNEQNYKASLSDIQQAIRSSIQIYNKYDPKRVQLENTLAQCHKFYRNYDKGIQVLHQTVKNQVFHKKDAHTTIAKTYFNMGLLYYQKGELQNAIQSFQKALDIYKKVLKGRFLKSPLRYKVILELGIIYLDQMDPKTDKLLIQYKEFIQKHKNRQQKNAQIGKTFNVIGLRQLRVKDINSAEMNFDKSIFELKIYGGQNYIQLGKVYFNLAIVLSFANRTADAKKLITKAQAVHKHNIPKPQEYQIHPLRAKAYWYQGQIHWIKDEFDQSIKLFQKSIQISNKYDKFCKLNEFICRLKIAQCLKGKLIKKQINEQDFKKFMTNLKKDIEQDLKQKKLFDGINSVYQKDNKRYGILKSIYIMTDDPKVKLLK